MTLWLSVRPAGPLFPAASAGGLSGVVQVMAAAAVRATVGIASQVVPAASGMPSDLLAGTRMLVGGLAPHCIDRLVTPAFLASIRSFDTARLLGFAVGSAVFQVCLFRSFDLQGVTATVVITASLPCLLSAGRARLRNRSALSGGTLLSLVVAFGGVLVFASQAPANERSAPRAAGLTFAVLASVTSVFTSVFARDLTRRTGPLDVAGVGISFPGVLLAAALPFLGVAIAVPQGLPTGQLPALVLYPGLGPTALAHILCCKGMATSRSTGVGLIASLSEPAIAALLAFIILHGLHGVQAPHEILGLLVIAVAMVVLFWAERRYGPASGRPRAMPFHIAVDGCVPSSRRKAAARPGPAPSMTPAVPK